MRFSLQTDATTIFFSTEAGSKGAPATHPLCVVPTVPIQSVKFGGGALGFDLPNKRFISATSQRNTAQIENKERLQKFHNPLGPGNYPLRLLSDLALLRQRPIS